MITIPLRITGETWYNRQDFLAAVSRVQPNDYVLIDVNSEGPSLGLFGIFEILARYHETNFIFIKWSNSLEPGIYPVVRFSEISHFFKLSRHYWIDEVPNKFAPNVFGLFIGRNTSARNYIMWDVHKRWKDKFLLSKMSSRTNNMWEEDIPNGAIKKDPLESWIKDASQRQQFKDWWANNHIPSIDNKSVRDQYHHPEQSAADCVLSLLSYYDQFNFELVCESYTRGTTFFPTEKTIRAIMGNKPFLVYGPVDYLKNLHKLGFKTFSGIWNEQYDLYEGPGRWNTMLSIIDMICRWDQPTRQNVLTQCASITQHNRNRLLELINDR